MGQEGFQDLEKQKQYRTLIRAFTDRPSHRNLSLLGGAYLSLFTSMRIDSTVNDEELFGVVEKMVKYEKMNPHITYAMGAATLAERKIHFREA